MCIIRKSIEVMYLCITCLLICYCTAALSCVGVWRWVEIAELFSSGAITWSRKKWREFCCLSLFVTLFDVMVAASLALALLSPLRWKVIGQFSYSRKEHVEYRFKVFCQCLVCMRDVVCILVGSLCLLSFTGEQLYTPDSTE